MRDTMAFQPGGFVDSQLLAFIGVAIVVVVLPGPDMALVARNVLRHDLGRSAGFATSIGICTGTIGWALAAAFGVSALLVRRWRSPHSSWRVRRT